MPIAALLLLYWQEIINHSNSNIFPSWWVFSGLHAAGFSSLKFRKLPTSAFFFSSSFLLITCSTSIFPENEEKNKKDVMKLKQVMRLCNAPISIWDYVLWPQPNTPASQRSCLVTLPQRTFDLRNVNINSYEVKYLHK